MTIDNTEASTMTTLEVCTSNENEVYVRVTSKRYVEALLADEKYELAITMAYRISSAYGEAVSTAALRNLVERQIGGPLMPSAPTTPFSTHRPATLENLFAAMHAQDDAETLYFLSCGVRIRWADEHWRRVALAVFASNRMQRSINFLLDKQLVPKTLGLDYLRAAVDSINCRLAVCLANNESVVRAFNALEVHERDTLNALYLYWKCRNLAEIARDVNYLVLMDGMFHLRNLTDEEFVRFVRLTEAFKSCTDEHVLYIRDHVLVSAAAAAGGGGAAARSSRNNPTGGMLAEIVDLIDRYPSFSIDFVDEMRQRLSIETTTTFVLPSCASTITASPFNFMMSSPSSATAC